MIDNGLGHALSVSYACNFLLASGDWILFPAAGVHCCAKWAACGQFESRFILNREPGSQPIKPFKSIGNSTFQSSTEKYDFHGLRLRTTHDAAIWPLHSAASMVHLPHKRITYFYIARHGLDNDVLPKRGRGQTCQGIKKAVLSKKAPLLKSSVGQAGSISRVSEL